MAKEQLYQLAQTTQFSRLISIAGAKWVSCLYRALPKLAGATVQGEAATTYFAAAIEFLERQIEGAISGYSSIRWKYYLRRLPSSVFAGSVGTTLPSKLALAESYCARSKSASKASVDSLGMITFRVDDATLRHLARLIAFVDLIYQLQVYYRLAGKGATFVWLNHFGLAPDAKGNSEVLDAVKIYDGRHDTGTFSINKILASLGIGNVSSHGGWRAGEDGLFLWFVTPEEPVGIKDFVSPSHYPEFFAAANGGTHVLARFAPARANLNAMLSIFQNDNFIDEAPSDALALSLVAVLLITRLLGTKPLSLLRTFELGYFILAADQMGSLKYVECVSVAKQFFAAYPYPASLLDFFQAVNGLAASTWPVAPVPYFKQTDDAIYVDVWAASQAFISWLQISKSQGSKANERAGIFEDATQTLLDSSLWRPSDSLRSYRQRTLFCEGKAITDVDAIGEREGELLLVSCKSLPYTLGYDRGDYKEVRNAQSLVCDAVKNWKSKVQIFASRQVGDNWDFRAYSKIHALVCTPFAVYSSDGEVLSEAFSGLRVCSSIDELECWLN